MTPTKKRPTSEPPAARKDMVPELMLCCERLQAMRIDLAQTCKDLCAAREAALYRSRRFR